MHRRLPRLPATGEAAGASVAPARALLEIVRLLPAATVELDAGDPAALRVVAGSASYALSAYPAEDFPRLPEVRPERTFAVDAPPRATRHGGSTPASSSDSSPAGS